jgi:hypothetical protein
MDKLLDKKEGSIFLPLTEIEDVIGAKLSFACSTTNEIRKTDPCAYNMAIERSLFTYFPDVIPTIPEELGYFRTKPEFFSQVTKFLKWASKELKMDILLPPNEQICFSGALKEIECFNLHLANTLDNELFISDIFLQDPNKPNRMGQTGFGFRGLSNGIFDVVIQNIERYAREEQYSKIGLLASNKINMEIFARRGFIIEETHMGERAKSIEMSYPMVKVLK